MSTTSITSIKVRNTDTQTDTNIELPLTGGVLTKSLLPANWSLSVYFSSSPIVTSTIFGATFHVDGGPAVNQESGPYVVNNKHPGLPLNLADGPHVIQWTADGQPVQSISFSIVDAPPVVTGNCIRGSNGDGIISDPHYDPNQFPILAQATADFGWSLLRLWTEGQIGSPFPSSEWTIPMNWKSHNVKILGVLNFQNSKQRCQAPSDADWITTLNSIPPASQTNVWGWEIGNEIDTNGPVSRGDVYWIGTPAQYAHLIAIAYPILKAKGYMVVLGNVLRSLNYYHTLLPLGAFNNCDYIGRHFYGNTAAENLGFLDELEAFAAVVKKGIANTEGNPRCPASQGIAQLQAQEKGFKQRSGIFLTFPMVNGGEPTDNFGPIDLSMTKSAYYTGYLPPTP